MLSSHQVGTGTLTLRLTTYPARAATYRQLVMGLAGAVSKVPAWRLADLAEVAEPLRAAVSHALMAVATDRVVLHGALRRLSGCLDDAAAGRPLRPDRLALALMGVVRAIGEEPAARPTAANALERVTGVIAAVSGRLTQARQ